MKKLSFAFFFSLGCCSLVSNSFCQGLNHQWLLGNYDFLQDPKGRMLIDSNSITTSTEYRKMVFKGTQANISDSNGNFLLSSNGVWIANANNDTLLNGANLNPSPFTTSWPNGQVIDYGNIFLPYPSQSSKYVLFHQTGDSLNIVPSRELFYSVIDMNLDGGLGGVDSLQKNIILFHDTLSWGIAACKHANGRDWWILSVKDSSPLAYIIYLDPNGINSYSLQNLNFIPLPTGNATQPTFSKDGKKFITTTYDDPISKNSSLVLCDFDRCSGSFLNTHVIHTVSGDYLWGLSFSPSGEYIYTCSSNYVFQIDVNSLTVDTVATYDGFISPPGFPSQFWNMYLAANGKIYITSGSSIQHLHVINYPDSAGAACDVQQHAIDLVDYLHLRAVPNHPNYYLGCDTTSGCPCLNNVGVNELTQHNFKFSISPNPTSGNIKIMYLLPQNRRGMFEVYDINGNKIFSYNLPQWSSLQNFSLPKLNDGIYSCVISSNGFMATKKLVVIK